MSKFVKGYFNPTKKLAEACKNSAAIMLAVFCENAGGSWDNAKKYIESLGEKVSPEHHAGVVGDTVGDPLKDSVVPSFDILIKIMSTVSIIFVSIFADFNLVSLINWLFK